MNFTEVWHIMEVTKIYMGVIFTYFRNSVFPVQLESKKILSTVATMATTSCSCPKNGYRHTSAFKNSHIKIGTKYFF
jgi:hypothetical protein